MAGETSPLSLLAAQEITGKKPENLVGLEKEDVEKYLEAQRGFIKSLEQRYAQPNWFNVAAGFAKPQLGGFLASLGSASQALGEQQEKQRDIELPLYKARSELAAYEMGLKQKAKAAANIETAGRAGTTLTPSQGMMTTALEQGPTAGAKVGSDMSVSQADQIMNAYASARNWTDLMSRLGGKYTEQTVADFFKNNPSMIPPVGTPERLLEAIKKPSGASAAPGAPAVAPSTGEVSPTTKPAEPTSDRVQIPGVDVSSLTYDQYREALKNWNALKQEKVSALSNEVGTQSKSGQKVWEISQQIHNLASDPMLANIFAMYEQGDVKGTIGKMLESQGLSSTLANIREYAQKRKLGGGEALRKLNNLETLMGDLQTQMQNAVINPTNERTRSEIASLPNLQGTQDAFLRTIRYIANEGLNRYENQLALEQAQKNPNFDPYYWTTNPLYQDIMHKSSARREAAMRSPGTQDLPSFMRGSIDQAAYKAQKKKEAAETKRMTAKELRELANKD